MADVTNLMEFNDISMEHMGFMQSGRLKLTDSSVSFKNQKTGQVMSLSADKLKACKWQRLANRHGIKLTMDDGQVHRFGGIPEEQQEKLSKFATYHWKTDLEASELCVKGWNYGEAKFDGPMLNFDVAEKPCFEIPLSNVSNATAGKNEAILEFHQNDECPVNLMEMRFHIPPDQQDAEGSDPIEEFLKNVLEYAGVVKETDKPLATLTQILCTTPRGRYDIKVYSSHLSLHGKTFDYKIPVKSIVRLFLLTHKDGRHMFFVMGLDPPIRQGQTRYPFMVLEFNKEDNIELEIGLTSEQIKQKYEGKLEKNLSGPYYEVVARIMRALVNQRVTIPGSFVGNSGTPAVSAAYKSTAGFLYPLEKGFVYVHKPAMYIRFEEVNSVYFARSDVSTRSFDFEVELKNGTVYVFNSIEKEEYTRLFDFIQKKNLRIKNAKGAGSAAVAYGEDWGSDDEADRDHYKERLKREAREREAADDDDDEDSEEEDSDYDPEKDAAKKKKEAAAAGGGGSDDDAHSGSGSEPDEEYDSAVENTSDEASGGEDSPAKKPKKASKPSKKREQSDKPSTSKKSGKRAKKDPNAPKRAQSAYMLWFQENRDQFKGDGLSVADVAKKGGEKWRSMTDDDKSKWTKMAEEDKKRAEREMTEWKAAGNTTVFTKNPSKSAKSSGGGAASSSNKSPTKAVSKEYVESSGSSSGSDDDDKPLKGKKKDTKEKPKPAADEAAAAGSGDGSSSDVEESGSGSGSGSD